ncbi:tryptophan 2,3-dioxygenase family protein [Streptomyces flaveolus]|uniref:tryptophan 2,3-dioxygenase family protein n=1 Tax=Streptomyces flaveolus TaxID=67297 RepID=UPI00342B3E75
MPESAYAMYLRLPELLSLQHPRSGSQEEIRASENFFIVVHQSAELLAQQVIVDLRAVVHASEHNPCDWVSAESRLSRAIGLLRFLRQHLTVLDHLPREHFHAFREKLGTASGHQSEQFAKIFAMLGRSEESHHPTPMFAALGGGENAGWSMSEPGDGGESGGGVPTLVMERLAALQEAVNSWRAAHITLVQRMLGDAPGTGGTAGAAWLQSRLVSAQDSDGPVPSADHLHRAAVGG